MFTRRHTAAGTDVRLGVGVAAIEGATGSSGDILTDGTRLPADLVVVGVGTVPETAWLADSGLDVRDGVVCDEHLAAVGAEGVYAVGDIARWQHPRYGEDVRVEHWTNAVETARWSRRTCGRADGLRRGAVRLVRPARRAAADLRPGAAAGRGAVRLRRARRRVRRRHRGDGRLRAVVGFGATKQLMPYRKLLVAGAAWDEALAL